MKRIKVVKIEDYCLTFDDGSVLSSKHEPDCCEEHYLDMSGLSLDDFVGLEFDLTGDFFERVEDYGILLNPISGHAVRIPGYGYNNGYYSSQLDLVLTYKNGLEKTCDITDCQKIND